jgi:hypothetical protein
MIFEYFRMQSAFKFSIPLKYVMKVLKFFQTYFQKIELKKRL